LGEGCLQDLLLECHQAVQDAGGCFSAEQADAFRLRSLTLLQQADTECPPPNPDPSPPRRGRQKRSKSRNLLERLRDFEDQTLRFMTDSRAPFTNNQAENDIRMPKVHPKISGCFRSRECATMFCRIRSYLSTCRKHGISSTRALSSLFQPRPLNFVDFFAPQPATTSGTAE
jgi:transposase